MYSNDGNFHNMDAAVIAALKAPLHAKPFSFKYFTVLIENLISPTKKCT